MQTRHVQHPARKPAQAKPVRKNAKSVWAKAIAALMAVTIAGCGGWDDVSSGESASTTAAKELSMDSPLQLSKLDGGTTTIPTGGVVDKGVSEAPAPSTAPAPSPQTAQVTTSPAPAPSPSPTPTPSPAPAPAASGGGTSVQSGGNTSVSPTPAPAPTPAPSSTPINSVDTILGDMQRMNDATLLNVNPVYGWAHGPGYVQMGNVPRYDNTPSWWQASNPSLVGNGYLSHLLPWAVQFEGVGNSASNTRIHIRNLRAYVLSRSSGNWQLTNTGDQLGGNFCPQNGNYYGCSTGAQQRAEPEGGYSFKPMPGMNFHGYFGGRQPINGPDVGAVFVTFEARLVVDNAGAGDDRSIARYLLHVGADYYPGDTSTVLMPAVAISRAKMLNNDWQAFNMITVEGAGIHEPGGGMPMAQFLSNPPPLN